jgi:hypothetical protein
MDDDFLQGDLRRPDDLRQLLRSLAYDDIMLVAAMIYADVDLPDGDDVWRFELVAPARLVVSRAALRVLSKYMEVLSEVPYDPRVVRVEIESLRSVLYELQCGVRSERKCACSSWLLDAR